MLHALLGGGSESNSAIEEKLRMLWADPARREELIEIVDVLHQRIRRVTPAWDQSSPVPLHLHARYSNNEVLVAFGVDRPAHMRGGVEWVEQHKADLFFVTIDKSKDEGWGAPPYVYAGPMTYKEHDGERPIRFLWRLDNALPADVFHDSKVTSG
ncbi:MAG: type restriction protein res subunit [Streptosporangiaceae bacterium]|nr:type restriction protein res subunit [Streptosporangiaceae bacterium]